MTASLTQHYINGRYATEAPAETFNSINPANGDVIATIAQADDGTMAAAIKSAKKGQAEWAAMTGIERSRILHKAVALLRERNDELALLEVLDTGKPIQEANCVDIVTGADVIEYYAGLADKIQGDYQQLNEQNFFYTRREPLGICAGIGAWNYPIQIACWKSAPALAAGNAMIFKPSEETPLSVLKLAEIYTEAGVPDGVFNVVQGDARVGQMLTAHPEIAKVSFTGECGTGKAVMGDSAKTLKQVTMELGGKSPLIIFPDTPVEQAVSGAMLANFYTQGEVCTNGTRVFVHDSLYDAFLDELKIRTERMIIGDPTHPKPTVFADCTDDMPQVIDEIFGPVMSVLRFSDEDEVVARANNTEFGLAAGVFTKDLGRAHRVINRLQAGICWINTWGASPAEMPVGGYKLSGVGRENGIETLYHYTQTKSVFVETGELERPY